MLNGRITLAMNMVGAAVNVLTFYFIRYVNGLLTVPTYCVTKPSLYIYDTFLCCSRLLACNVDKKIRARTKTHDSWAYKNPNHLYR